MWPFRRKQTDSTIQDYYQTENNQRTGVAWLLGIGTLLVTVAVVLGLFYGGRWVYHKVRKQEQPQVAQVETKEPETKTDTNQSSGSQSGTSTPVTTPSPSAQTPSSKATPTPSPTPTTNTAVQGKGGSNIPNTGPGNIVGTFVIISTLGYLLHRRFQRSTGVS